MCMGTEVVVCAFEDAEILAQCTHNEALFVAKLYRPEDAPVSYTHLMQQDSAICGVARCNVWINAFISIFAPYNCFIGEFNLYADVYKRQV